MSKTLIRVALASIVVCRDGERGTVPAGTAFEFLEHEVVSATKANPNFLRKADDQEIRGASKFSDLKGRKKIKGVFSAQAKASKSSAELQVTSNANVVDAAKPTREELEQMSVPELNALAAADDSVVVPNKATKAQLIAALAPSEDDGEL